MNPLEIAAHLKSAPGSAQFDHNALAGLVQKFASRLDAWTRVECLLLKGAIGAIAAESLLEAERLLDLTDKRAKRRDWEVLFRKWAENAKPRSGEGYEWGGVGFSRELWRSTHMGAVTVIGELASALWVVVDRTVKRAPDVERSRYQQFAELDDWALPPTVDDVDQLRLLVDSALRGTGEEGGPLSNKVRAALIGLAALPDTCISHTGPGRWFAAYASGLFADIRLGTTAEAHPARVSVVSEYVDMMPHTTLSPAALILVARESVAFVRFDFSWHLVQSPQVTAVGARASTYAEQEEDDWRRRR